MKSGQSNNTNDNETIQNMYLNFNKFSGIKLTFTALASNTLAIVTLLKWHFFQFFFINFKKAFSQGFDSGELFFA